jgi:hypothetical protein
LFNLTALSTRDFSKNYFSHNYANFAEIVTIIDDSLEKMKFTIHYLQLSMTPLSVCTAYVTPKSHDSPVTCHVRISRCYQHWCVVEKKNCLRVHKISLAKFHSACSSDTQSSSPYRPYHQPSHRLLILSMHSSSEVLYFPSSYPP